MFSSLQIKLAVIGLLIAWGLGTVYLLKSYIIAKHQTDIVRRQLTTTQAQITKQNEVFLNIEKKKDEEIERANKALVEIHKDGYVHTSDSSNPTWMRSDS